MAGRFGNRSILYVVYVLALCGIGQNAEGQTNRWRIAGFGRWEDSDRWTLGRPPNLGDNVVISGANSTVLLSSDGFADSLFLDQSSRLRVSGSDNRLLVNRLSNRSSVDLIGGELFLRDSIFGPGVISLRSGARINFGSVDHEGGHQIIGAGTIGFSSSVLNNRGRITANSGRLAIEGVVNNSGGVLESLNGALVLNRSRLSNGTILGNDVQAIDASVTGSQFLSGNVLFRDSMLRGGEVQSASITLDGVNRFLGNVTNNGRITVTGRSRLEFDRNANLTGRGELEIDGGLVTGVSQAFFSLGTGDGFVNNLRVRGHGQLGNGNGQIRNRATVIAENGTLSIGSLNRFTNEHELRASSTGVLDLGSNSYDNNSGTIRIAGEGSVVSNRSRITGGDITVSNGGVFGVQNGGQTKIENAQITNDGVIEIGSRPSRETRLEFGNDIVINGNGEIQLTAADFSILSGESESSEFALGAGITTRGQGRIEQAARVTNFGLIVADQQEAITLAVDRFVNLGTVDTATGGITVDGIFEQGEGGNLHLSDGSFVTKTPLEIISGTITGSGVVEAAETNIDALLQPGDSAGKVTFDGDLNLLENAVIEVEIGGLAQSEQFDAIFAETISLDGTLELSLIDAFEFVVSADQTFSILEAESLLTGSFSNVANGQRLAVANGFGSFQVNYGDESLFSSNAVVLSHFSAVPEPTSFAMLSVFATVMFIKRRRRLVD